MLKLHGFPVSNYYNMAKACLIEKGLEFEEVSAVPSREADFLAKSPMGKVPCLETDQGFISETYAISDYLDQIQPAPALLPSDPFARAKAIELIRELELYVELVARRVLPEAMFNRGVSDETKAQVEKDLTRGIAAVSSRVVCAPYIAGPQFSFADIFAYYTFSLQSQVVQKIYGTDLLADLPQVKALLTELAERDSIKRCDAEAAAARG